MVLAGGEGDLCVVDVLPAQLGSVLVDHLLEIIRALEATTAGDEDLNEVAEVAIAEPTLQLCLRAGGKVNPVSFGQIEKRRGPDRALEMDVEFGLRNGADIVEERHLTGQLSHHRAH